MADYSEKVLAEVCGSHGICTKEEFFPSVAKLKYYLDEVASRDATAERNSARLARQLQERAEFDAPRNPEMMARLAAHFKELGEHLKSGLAIPRRKGEHASRHNTDYQKSLDIPCYERPIENVKPGDILSWERQQEYREYMAKKHNMPNVKLWGINEKYEDGGNRPFDKSDPEEPNPFV